MDIRNLLDLQESLSEAIKSKCDQLVDLTLTMERGFMWHGLDRKELELKASKWDTFHITASAEVQELIHRAKNVNKQDLSYKLIEAKIGCLRKFLEL